MASALRLGSTGPLGRELHPIESVERYTPYRSSLDSNLSLPRSGSDLIYLSAKRLDGLVGHWGSADRSWTLELQFAAPVVRLGPSGRPARRWGGRGEETFMDLCGKPVAQRRVRPARAV